jgi:hypothetical protein
MGLLWYKTRFLYLSKGQRGSLGLPWGDDLFGLSFQGKGVHVKKDFVTYIEMIMEHAKRKGAIGRMWKW